MDRPYHHGDLRASLVALAYSHIVEHGVESLSVRSLAKSAGVAHRAAYQHFPDKDGLIAATLTEAYRRLGARIADGADKRSGPETALMRVAGAYAAFAFEEPQMFLAMAGPRVNAAGTHKELEEAIASCWRHVAGPIGAGIDAGLFTIADKRAAAAIFWCGLSGILTQAALGRLKLKSAERAPFMDAAAARLIAGLKA